MMLRAFFSLLLLAGCGSNEGQSIAPPQPGTAPDLNPRWGCNGVAAAYVGPLEPGTVVIQDREEGAGGYTDHQRNIGYVAYRANTATTWRAYVSHVAINLLTYPHLAGQSVEAWDYRYPDYSEAGPYELADFDFPSRHGLGGQYFDWRGRAAYDLLSKLPYP